MSYKIAIDGCTNLTEKVNVLVFEDTITTPDEDNDDGINAKPVDIITKAVEEGLVDDRIEGLVSAQHTPEDIFERNINWAQYTTTAGDIDADSDVEIINKDQEIATLAKGGKLNMELLVANGRGYVPSNENKKFIEDESIGFIPIDAIYSPIERVSYEVESARIGQDANYDKLIMEVSTNGSIKPEEAMALSARIMIEHLNIVTNLDEIADITGIMNAKQEDTKLKKLETSIDDLDFSVRAYNCLKRAGVNTLGDLTAKSELEMMKVRNLGKKSLKEVIDKVKDMGLKFREED